MSDHIDELDASLAENGEDIVLRRVIAGVKNEVTVRAHVRNFRLNASDIVTGISKVPFIVIMSMTQIIAAGWPADAPARAAPPFDIDPRIPVIGDFAIIKGVIRAVKSVNAIAVNGEIVKIQMMVEG